MTGNIHSQRGVTFTGLAALVGLIAFFALIAIRLAPIYIENFSIVSAMKSTFEQEGVDDMSAGEIQQSLTRRMSIDNVDAIDGSDVVVSRDEGALVLSVEYEVRTAMFGNVDLVVSFDERVEAK